MSNRLIHNGFSPDDLRSIIAQLRIALTSIADATDIPEEQKHKQMVETQQFIDTTVEIIRLKSITWDQQFNREHNVMCPGYRRVLARIMYLENRLSKEEIQKMRKPKKP